MKLFLAVMLGCTALVPAHAATELYEYAFNVNGTLHHVSPAAASTPSFAGVQFNSSLDYSTGLGSVTFRFLLPGTHNVVAWFNHDIDSIQNSFFNETGSSSGTPLAGESFEIDDPLFGDIFAHLVTPPLDNTSIGGAADISMALARELILLPGQTGLVTFRLGTTAPSGFYLKQTDPDSNTDIYLSSDTSIQTAAVPEPSTFALMALAVAGWMMQRGRTRRY